MAYVGVGEMGSGGGSYALFYQSPDGNWHYATGGQDDFPCALGGNVDAKKALIGVKCYDPVIGKESVVTL